MKTMLELFERTLEVETVDDSSALVVVEDGASLETNRGRLFFELREYVTECASSEKELREELGKVFAFFESLPALPEPEPEPETEPEPEPTTEESTTEEPVESGQSEGLESDSEESEEKQPEAEAVAE